MLHELLLALSGHHGGVFVKDDKGNIQVVLDLPFLHPSEEALLTRLCRLATHYTKFQAFIRENTHSPGGGNKNGLHGLYIRTLCDGLDKVLDPYRQDLLSLEKDLLADPHLTAAHVQASLEKYQMLFPALSSMLDQIFHHQVHGCHVLEILHRASASGIPIVKDALLQILHVCHSVLYKQLAGWMLHGMLLDHYDEFFIFKSQSEPQQQQAVGAEDEDLGLSANISSQIKHILKLTEDDPSNYEQFALRIEMLPSYIPSRVADKILFVGESVQMFEKDKNGAKLLKRGSIMQSKGDIFAKELLQLSQQPEFSLMEFEAVIDTIRTFVAEQLWQLIVEQADLMGNLRIMKDFFLLGRGELYLAFIDQAEVLLRAPPTGTTQHDVNLSFQQAARNVLLEDDQLLQKFHFVVDPKFLDKKETSKSKSSVSSEAGQVATAEVGWNTISLKYSVDWPLHILLTQGVLSRYNILFKFLLFVKRTQLELQHCWAQHMQQRHLGTRSTSGPKWWLRNHMAFLVDNLQYYMQVDVIESQFSILQEKIQTTRDFEAIRFAHEHFITCLLSQSFLLMKPIAHCLHEILELCHNFCVLVMHAEDELTDRENAHLETITKNFQKQSNLLFKFLSSVRNHQSSPHLAQLLLRIDFNRYFTSAGGKLGRCLVDVKVK